jgi:hypothetical protein
MNELFQPAQEFEQLLDPNGVAIQQLRFTGNRAAFVRADFEEFLSLLSGHAV